MFSKRNRELRGKYKATMVRKEVLFSVEEILLYEKINGTPKLSYISWLHEKDSTFLLLQEKHKWERSKKDVIAKMN